ncbi:hypothetical protein NGRA_2278 [Nosema granulosis]|uniref:Peptidase A2 domain-containing protein n=1 Tax=Nosema granulosis TaxID=83296 RepID=A0A9P6KYL3_9MICR|nr:hypothetical protein NGRA_2278 [Nosema granulosis]
MEYNLNKAFISKHDKMSSSSGYNPKTHTHIGEQPHRTSPTTRAAGPLHLLNSIEAKQIEKNFQNLTFTTKIEGVDLAEPPQTTVYLFTDENIQDPLDWSREIKHLAGTNNWSEESAKNVLSILISDEYKQRIGDKRAFETKLDALCRVVYSPERFEPLRNVLTSSTRRSFSNFESYFHFLNRVKVRADLCLNYKTNGDKIPERDIIDIILKELSNKEREMLMNIQAMSLPEIKKALIKFEQVQHFYKVSINLHEKSQTEPRLSKQSYPSKFCSFHKSYKHNIDECVAFTNWKKRNETSKSKYNKNQDVLAIEANKNVGSLNETDGSLKLLLTSSLNNIPVKLVIDTGSDLNFISRETSKKIPNAKSTMLDNTYITLANGTRTKISEKVLVNLSVQNKVNIESEEEFYIIDDLPHEGLVGQAFLQKHECIISYKGEYSSILNSG